MGRRVAALGLGLLMSAGAALPVGASEHEPPQLCAAAAVLTSAGYPQRALTLLEEGHADLQTDAPACPEELRAAVGAKAGAEILAFRAGELLGAGVPAENDREAAGGHVSEALRLDAENAEALALDEQIEAAIADKPAPLPTRVSKAWSTWVKDSLSPLGDVALAWAGVAAGLFVIARLLTGVRVAWTPMSRGKRRIVVILGLVGVTWGAAQLTLGFANAAEVVPDSTRVWIWSGVSFVLVAAAFDAIAAPPRRRVVLGALGGTFAAALVAVAAFRVLGPGAAALDGGASAWFAASAGAACAAGVALTAIGLATRLRLTVDVRSDTAESRTAAGHIVALLDALGAEAPAGLEAPQGTDVKVLANGALAETPTNKVAAAVVGLIGVLLGVTPWRVVVDEEENGTIAVIITRNGRKAETAVIEREALGLGEELAKAGDKPEEMRAVDLHRMVAAVVMTTLARYHDGFEGLCGGTQWRALGLYFIATTDFDKDRKRRLALVSRAVDDDPGNWLAQVAWAQSRWRGSAEAADHAAHYAWLNARIETGPPDLGAVGFASLALRLRLGRALVAVNRYFAEDGAASNAAAKQQAREDAAEAVDDLATHVERIAPPDRIGADAWPSRRLEVDPALLRQVKTVGAGLIPLFQHRPGDRELDLTYWGDFPFGPRACYALGCALAAPIEPPEAGAESAAAKLAERLGIGGQDDEARAIEAFKLATGDPRLLQWIGADPQLKSFRKTAAYRTAFGATPRAALLEIEPFATHAAALKRFELVAADALAGVVVADLLRYAAIPETVANRLKSLAELRASMPATGALAELGVEVMAELIGLELADRAVLAAKPGDEKVALAVKVAGAVVGRCATETSEADLRVAVENWLQRL